VAEAALPSATALGVNGRTPPTNGSLPTARTTVE
jgi:hypothetical protein